MKFTHLLYTLLLFCSVTKTSEWSDEEDDGGYLNIFPDYPDLIEELVPEELYTTREELQRVKDEVWRTYKQLENVYLEKRENSRHGPICDNFILCCAANICSCLAGYRSASHPEEAFAYVPLIGMTQGTVMYLIGLNHFSRDGESADALKELIEARQEAHLYRTRLERFDASGIDIGRERATGWLDKRRSLRLVPRSQVSEGVALPPSAPETHSNDDDDEESQRG